MMKLFAPLALLLLCNPCSLAQLASWSGKAPWFCHGINCPHYTMTLLEPEYEVRNYGATNWASTDIVDMRFEPALPEGFMRLFNYLGSGNDNGTEIEMSAPVIVEIAPGADSGLGSAFTMSFFLPFDMEDIPIPLDDDLSLHSRDATTVYVRTFEGFADEGIIVEQAAILAAALTAAGVEFQPDAYTYGGYDPPFRPVDRHNELWFYSPGQAPGIASSPTVAPTNVAK